MQVRKVSENAVQITLDINEAENMANMLSKGRVYIQIEADRIQAKIGNSPTVDDLRAEVRKGGDILREIEKVLA